MGEARIMRIAVEVARKLKWSRGKGQRGRGFLGVYESLKGGERGLREKGMKEDKVRKGLCEWY